MLVTAKAAAPLWQPIAAADWPMLVCVCAAEAIHVPALNRESVTPEEALRVRNLRDKVFMTNAIPNWVAVVSYVCLAAISIGVTPQLWPGVKVGCPQQ